MTIREALNNVMVTYYELRYALRECGIGEWYNVVSTDDLIEIAFDKLKDGEKVSHIIAEVESIYCEEDEWYFDRDDIRSVPTPINDKEDLIEALGISEDEMDERIYISVA